MYLYNSCFFIFIFLYICLHPYLHLYLHNSYFFLNSPLHLYIYLPLYHSYLYLYCSYLYSYVVFIFSFMLVFFHLSSSLNCIFSIFVFNLISFYTKIIFHPISHPISSYGYSSNEVSYGSPYGYSTSVTPQQTMAYDISADYVDSTTYEPRGTIMDPDYVSHGRRQKSQKLVPMRISIDESAFNTRITTYHTHYHYYYYYLLLLVLLILAIIVKLSSSVQVHAVSPSRFKVVQFLSILFIIESKLLSFFAIISFFFCQHLGFEVSVCGM